MIRVRALDDAKGMEGAEGGSFEGGRLLTFEIWVPQFADVRRWKFALDYKNFAELPQVRYVLRR